MNSSANNDFSFRTERLMHLNFSRSFQLLQRKVHCENLHLSWMHGRLRFFISPISISGGLENSCHRCEFVGGGGGLDWRHPPPENILKTLRLRNGIFNILNVIFL